MNRSGNRLCSCGFPGEAPGARRAGAGCYPGRSTSEPRENRGWGRRCMRRCVGGRRAKAGHWGDLGRLPATRGEGARARRPGSREPEDLQGQMTRRRAKANSRGGKPWRTTGRGGVVCPRHGPCAFMAWYARFVGRRPVLRAVPIIFVEGAGSLSSCRGSERGFLKKPRSPGRALLCRPRFDSHCL